MAITGLDTSDDVKNLPQDLPAFDRACASGTRDVTEGVNADLA